MSYLCTVGSERRGRVFSLTNTYTFPSFALVRTREMKGIWRETDWFFNQDSTNYVEHLHEKTQSVTASNKSVIVVKVVKLISGNDRLFIFTLTTLTNPSVGDICLCINPPEESSKSKYLENMRILRDKSPKTPSLYIFLLQLACYLKQITDFNRY